MKKFLLVVFFLFPLLSYSQQELKTDDKIRIAEGLKMSEFVSDNIWKGWSKTNFTILFLSDSLEYLINHPNPSEDFTQSYFDSYLNTKVYIRKKVFQENSLATFPAVNGINTVVVGTPENTGRSSISWTITLLHEHFHQYQFNLKNYFDKLNNLDLSNGDNSGMWVLNYNFAYEDTSVNRAFNDLKIKLHDAYTESGIKSFKKKTIEYLKAKKDFKNLVSEKDSKYLEFQLWQEGLARYTEYTVLSYLTKNKYKPSDDFTKLKDYEPLEQNYEKRINKLKDELQKVNLAEQKRVCFYSMGAIEGLVLDRYQKSWRNKYTKNMFNTSNLFIFK